MYVDEYIPLIGTESPSLPQQIHASRIRRFAEAIRESNKLYFDEQYAASTPYGRMIAPPTFCFTLEYPSIPNVWIAPKGRLHVSQEFCYQRPIFAEEIVYCSQRLSNAYEKDGRRGLMVYLELERIVRDASGSQICSSKSLSATPEAMFRLREQEGQHALADEPLSTAGSLPRCFSPGQELEKVVLPPYRNDDVCRYAAASGDCNPIHLDDAAAQKAGFPSRLVHGMLSMALQEQIIQQWVGPFYSLERYSMRFKQPVFPGDQLTICGHVADDSTPDHLRIQFYAQNQHGQTPLTGSADLKKSETSAEPSADFDYCLRV